MSQPHPRSADDGGAPAAPPGVPRWVKLSALVVVVLVLALIAVMAVVGGDHGPARHALDRVPAVEPGIAA